jgi:CheY-like chemotaxis protein
LWLPVADPIADRRTPDAERPPRSARGETLDILVVDDDSLVLMNTVAMLEDLGHHVRGADSAVAALTAIGERRPDLVITDYAMPEMTGVQLAEEIAESDSRLPVILATGYAELPPGAGANLHRLPKPYMQGDLAAAIDRVAGQATTREPA